MLQQFYAIIPRRLWQRMAGRRTGLAADGGTLDRRHVESRWLHLTRPVVPVPGLPAAWDGLRIAHLTDLHAGPICGLAYLRRVVERTNAASPDVIVVTGDFTNDPRVVTPELIDLLATLRAPLGRFAVLGNHDHTAGPRRVAEGVAAAGIELLTNSHVILRRAGQALCLAGVDDYMHGAPDARRALAGVDPAVPRVVLCHNPDYVPYWPPDVRADLVLCGHTHGGQFRVPCGPAPLASARHRRYIEGLVWAKRFWVYTSRGVGMSHIPLRLNCRPELPVITLRHGTVRGKAAAARA